MINITEKNFDEQLEKAAGEDNTLANRIQALIIFGMKECYSLGKTGEVKNNSTFLTKIQNTKFRSVRMAAVQVYIEDHTDLVWTKDKKGSRYTRDAISGWEFKVPTKTWDAYSNAGMEVKIMDFETAKKQFLTRWSNVLNGKASNAKLKEGQEDSVKEFLAANAFQA